MAIVPNRHYNDPNLGAAFSSLAGLFAPASPQELVGYADAKATNEKASRLAQLFELSKNGIDTPAKRAQLEALAIGAGELTPSQGYYAVDQGNLVDMRGQDITAQTTLAANALDNQTQRYGYDTTARTSRLNNADDNQRALITSFFEGLSPGEIAPAVPGEILAPFGLPEIAERRGAPKPLSMDELSAAILSKQPENIQTAAALDSVPVETIVGPDGKPVITYRADAVGKQPYLQKGTEAKPELLTAQTADGRSVPVRVGVDGIPVDVNSGQPVANVTRLTKLGQPTGSNEELGLTTSTEGEVQKRALAARQVRSTVGMLRNLIAANPSSQGLVGALRGTAQDLIQTGGEVGALFGGQVKEAEQAVRSGLVDAGVASAAFDPSLPAIQFYQNVLAWQYARMQSGDRVSNEQFRAAQQAIGGDGWLSNQADTLARLDELDRSMASELEAAAPYFRPADGAPAVPVAPGSPIVIETPNGPVKIKRKGE